MRMQYTGFNLSMDQSVHRVLIIQTGPKCIHGIMVILQAHKFYSWRDFCLLLSMISRLGFFFEFFIWPIQSTRITPFPYRINNNFLQCNKLSLLSTWQFNTRYMSSIDSQLYISTTLRWWWGQSAPFSISPICVLDGLSWNSCNCTMTHVHQFY